MAPTRIVNLGLSLTHQLVQHVVMVRNVPTAAVYLGMEQRLARALINFTHQVEPDGVLAHKLLLMVLFYSFVHALPDGLFGFVFLRSEPLQTIFLLLCSNSFECRRGHRQVNRSLSTGQQRRLLVVIQRAIERIHSTSEAVAVVRYSRTISAACIGKLIDYWVLSHSVVGG